LAAQAERAYQSGGMPAVHAQFLSGMKEALVKGKYVSPTYMGNKQRWRDDVWSRCAIFRRPTNNAMLTLSIWSTIRRLMRYARSQHLRASQERCGYRTQSKSAVERANFGKQKYPGAQLGQTWASLRRPRWHRLRFRSRPLRLCQLPSPPQLQLFHRFSTHFFIRMPPHL